MTTIIGLHRR